MPAPEEVNEATHEFLRDHPDAETALETLLARDETGPWTFDDVDLDSGRFGELVSRDIAEQTDNGMYRLRHPEAVEAALNGETVKGDSGDETASIRSVVPETLSVRELVGVLGALAIVVAARVHIYPSVFRDGHVVSPGNDPYFYRYWQEQLLEQSDGVTDFGLLADMGGAASSRPLTHALNWWLAELLGGTAGAAAFVAAWLPILGAVALGCVLYLLAKLLTGDVRVGLAAVAFLGVAPVHVMYTSLGFLEHRLHQYLWLGVLALAVTWLAIDIQRRHEAQNDGAEAAWNHFRAPTSWAVAGVVALAVAASAHIWSGSPLTFIPIAIYVSLRVVADVRAGVSPMPANAPLVGGLAGGAGLAVVLHLGLGWHNSLAAGTPILLTIGAVGVVTLAEAWQRFELPARALFGVEALVTAAGLLGFWVFEPIDSDLLFGRIEALLFREGAIEAGSLFAAEQTYFLGPLFQIGISFYFGLAALAVGTLFVARRYEPGWLLSVCFAWYYTILASLQARFTAQLVIFISLFAGVAVVYLLAKVELVRPFEPFERTTERTKPAISIPSGRQSGYLVGTVCLLLIFNFIFVPALVGNATYNDEQFEAALTIDDHATEMERSYPETAVDTEWGEIRMYNYFVNGESGSYDSRYEPFLTAFDPDENTRLRQNGRYVVINRLPESPDRISTYSVLFEGLGVGYGDVEGTSGRYQPVYVGDDHRAFTLVEGATFNVSGEDGQQVTAVASVEVDGETVQYEREGVIENGFVTIQVAHSGEYTVAEETVTVSEDAVHQGEQFEIGAE